MQAYEVGVEIALKGIGPQLAKVIEDFKALDQVMSGVNRTLSGLGDAMRLISRESAGISRSWKDIAASASKFAAATRGAAGTTGRTGSAGGAGEPAAGGVLSRALVPYLPPGLPAPYRSGSRDYTLQGTPYTPYGGYGISAPQRPSGGLPVPYAASPGGGGPGTGFTLNGGPYGPPYEGAVVPYQGQGRQIPLNYRPDSMPWDQRWMMRPGGTGGDPFVGTVGAGLGLKMVGDSIKLTAEYQNVLAGLRAQFNSQDMVNKASQQAFAVQRAIAGSDVMGNLRLLGDIMATTQSAEESLKLLPAFAQMQVWLGRFGKAGEPEMIAAIKGAEESGQLGKVDPTTGKFALNQASLDRYLKTVLAATVVTRGQVDPQAILQFQRAANWVTPNVDPEVMIGQNLAMMQALGSSRAGRGIFAVEQQWAAGQMSQAALKLATDPILALVKGGQNLKANPYVAEKAFGTYIVKPEGWEPGVSEKLRTDPQGFLMLLVGKLDNYLTQKIQGFSTMSPEQKGMMEIAYGSAISSRDPARAYLGELIQLRGLIDRDRTAMQNQMTSQTQQFLTENNAAVNMQAMAAALQALQIAATTPAMKQVIDGLNSVSGGLNAMSAWASSHAEATKIGLDAVTASLAVMGGASLVKFALALGPVPTLLAGVAGGTVAFTAALQKLDGWLKTAFPGVFTNAPLHEIQTQGGVKLPWWAPLPNGPGGREAAPPWVSRTWHELGMGSAQGAPNAPIASDSGAIRVHVDNQVPVHVVNMGDAAHPVASGIANLMNAPNSGTLGHDSRIDAGGAWVGGGP
jgi:hypothetical protein